MTAKPAGWIIVLLAAIVATTPLAIDMYLPAMPLMAQQLDTTIGMVQQSLSIFLAFFGISMLLCGPLADSLGRRPLAIFGLTGFVLASLALSLVSSIEWFLFWRALQAFCGAAATVVVPGIVRHIYQEHTAKGMSYVSMMMMLAPLLALTLAAVVAGFLLLVPASASWKVLRNPHNDQDMKAALLHIASQTMPGDGVVIDSMSHKAFDFYSRAYGVQAMPANDPTAASGLRVLTLAVSRTRLHASDDDEAAARGSPPRKVWVEFAVTDHGHGLSEAVRQQLFTPFFTTKAEGMGLGLSLCRTVIEQHGGALEHGPADPRGTVFRFTLPAAPV